MAIKTLADVCEIVMGQSPAGEMCNASGIGAPLLNGPTEYGVHHPKPVQFTTDVRKRAKEGDLLFCVRGSTTGRMNWADRDYAIGRGIAAIRHKSHRELQPMVRAVVEHNLPNLLIQATGSTFPNVSSGQLSNLPWPDLDGYQERAIAHILGTLDDKIELNRKQNETLEAMARTLFKAWFVDFEPVRAKMEGRWRRGDSLPGLPAHLYDLFPERLVDSELGEIPEGWDICPLSQLLIIIGGGTPNTSNSEYWNGDIPWFSVVDTPRTGDVFIIETEKSITQLGLVGSSARLIPEGTSIISARGTVGNLAIAGRDMTFNQSCYGLRAADGGGDYFVYLVVRQMVDQLKAMAHGSVFSTITRQTFDAIRQPTPPSFILEALEICVSPWFEIILSNLQESHTLVQLRNTLLPKLIAGELRTNESFQILEKSI